jgi:carbon-monoxide dehydrogenase medium subunit
MNERRSGQVHAKISRIHHPGTAGELLALLGKGRGRVAPVGGGVSFSFSVPPKVTELASIRALGLDYVRLDARGLHLGAAATLGRLASSPCAMKFMGGLFASAAGRVAAITNRNMITVGGNAVRLFIWSDLPVVYCAAGARFVLRGARGTRRLSAEQFYKSLPASWLRGAEFLREIVIPPAAPRAGAAYEKFCETENTFALVSAAACVELGRGGVCASARLALGGLQLPPRVSQRAAEALEGGTPSAERIREAAAAAVEEVKAVRDIRAGSEYKKRLAAVVARRALEKAFAAAGAPQAGGARS